MGWRFHWLVGAMTWAVLTACDSKKAAPPPPAATASSGQIAPSAAPPVKSAHAESPERDEVEPPGVADAGAVSLGEPNDVGPGAPSAASAQGVVLITKSDEISLARLGTKGVTQVKTPADQFALGRGPSVADGFAYWVSKGRLVRRALNGGALEVLAPDARSGTRVTAVPPVKGVRPAVASFIGAPVTEDGGSTARLWVEGKEPLMLTPSGSAATSVSLVVHGDDVLALSLEGRTGMTPVHARRIRFENSAPKLDEDVVVWVAGPAQSLTEITAAVVGDHVLGFVPMARDITRFGLAQIQLGNEPSMGAPIVWRGYPNGLDPAAVATSHGACGTYLVYARPAEARPRSPQELHVARATADGLGKSEVIARGSAFANVSAAETESGILVSYVADFRTWARVLPCPKNATP